MGWARCFRCGPLSKGTQPAAFGRFTGQEPMPGDLISLRILAVFAAQQDRDLLRGGCAAVSVPVDLIEAGAGAGAVSALGRGDIDLILLDAGIAGPDRATVVAAAGAAKPPPLVILVGANRAEA